ncbi:MAG: CRISPR-associated endonuclease Cas2 [Gammaproteobacteria bacterium]|nr:CRISPR-associated endonuclease Cas2 [Gammaproteobacteria bacterium]
MQKKGWYLIAYDIKQARRLKRVHRFFKKRALWVQQSVFFAQCSEAELHDWLNEALTLMELKEDDLRAWPIYHPSKVWLQGESPFREGLTVPDRSRSEREGNPLTRLFRRFLGEVR